MVEEIEDVFVGDVGSDLEGYEVSIGEIEIGEVCALVTWMGFE